MKIKYINNNWTRCITVGVLAAGFMWMGCYDSVQAKPVEGKPYTISLSGNVNLDMIWVKPGSFKMGSPKKEEGRDDDEHQHQVTLTQGYWMGKYEVTQEQYEAVMGAANPSEFVGKKLPVQNVSWDDAMEFCTQLTETEKEAGRLPKGYKYTLPTEAQWEYACRAGTETALNNKKNLEFENGEDGESKNLNEVAWYEYNSDEQPHPVGGKKPNALKLYDMHGNVWEWCLDWYGDYPTSAVTDPTGPKKGSEHVVRGGSWSSDVPRYCRSANRGTDSDDRIIGVGFRVALTPVK